MISRSDPSEHALEAFAQVVDNLGWGGEAEKIVFAHTHQPLADVRSSRRRATRYWNTGSWIYEPDLGSRQAYARYLRYAWPGTAVLIDDDEPSRACWSCSPTSTRSTAARATAAPLIAARAPRPGRPSSAA